MNGIEAVDKGFANRAYPADQLDAKVLEHAERVAKVPTDIQQMNKRSIHHAMEIMGMRAAIRAGGSTLRDFCGPDGMGDFQVKHKVYDRAGEPCLKCGAPIKAIRAAGMTSADGNPQLYRDPHKFCE